MKNLVTSIWQFYVDGFRSMTLGRTLWLIIAIKLFIMFFILRLFFFPGQSGGKAAAEVLFGDYNPAGRLPVTFYRNIAQLPDFEDYNMTGRTYRYFKGDPLFPFGYGLSYTTFNYGNIKLEQTIKVGETAKMVIPVTNAGVRKKIRDGEFRSPANKRLSRSSMHPKRPLPVPAPAAGYARNR